MITLQVSTGFQHKGWVNARIRPGFRAVEPNGSFYLLSMKTNQALITFGVEGAEDGFNT